MRKIAVLGGELRDDAAHRQRDAGQRLGEGVTELVDRRHGFLAFVAWISRSYRRRDGSSGELTEEHMRLLAWLDAHPTGSLAVAAQALDLVITDVEGLCTDLMDAGMIERARAQ